MCVQTHHPHSAGWGWEGWRHFFQSIWPNRRKILAFKTSRAFPSKCNHGDRKSIRVSDESPRLNWSTKLKQFYSRRATNFSPALFRQRRALASSQSRRPHADILKIPSTGGRRRNEARKGKNPKLKGESLHTRGENERKIQCKSC